MGSHRPEPHRLRYPSAPRRYHLAVFVAGFAGQPVALVYRSGLGDPWGCRRLSLAVAGVPRIPSGHRQGRHGIWRFQALGAFGRLGGLASAVADLADVFSGRRPGRPLADSVSGPGPASSHPVRSLPGGGRLGEFDGWARFAKVLCPLVGDGLNSLVVAITGGIGSGKTTVARQFATLGVPVIDTDEIARILVEPGQPALAEILSAFGPEVLDARQQLNRTTLRQRVFGDPARRRQLEAILHPRILTEVHHQLADCDGPYVMVVVPLLIEAGWHGLADRILVVDVDETTQIERATRRDGLPLEALRAILATQCSRAERLAFAQDRIDNQGSLADTREAVAALHQTYLRMATAGTLEKSGLPR
ncbi:dephospho-CoA kinase [Gammaproteobacteria bacterium]